MNLFCFFVAAAAITADEGGLSVGCDGGEPCLLDGGEE